MTKSEIARGGSSVYEFDGKIYLVSVAYLAVNTKSETDCRKVGQAKAKREMLSYINGSEITSYTTLVNSETTEDALEGRRVVAKQEYTEFIRETVKGTINQIVPLTSWYSEDKSVYYFAIYKIL